MLRFAQNTGQVEKRKVEGSLYSNEVDTTWI
jgi:hypothetical protein